MTKNADYWIKQLKLISHPEGGYYRETYRSLDIVKRNHLPSKYNRSRCFSTSIYFLLKGNHVSHFHKIKSDELWYFHCGSSLTIYKINQIGKLSKLIIGGNPENKELLQVTIPAETWFGGKLTQPKKTAFSLVSCSVAPGFEFEDFELGERDKLIKQFPQHENTIKQLTAPQKAS